MNVKLAEINRFNAFCLLHICMSPKRRHTDILIHYKTVRLIEI